ncbi:hypothetical protein Moror_2443 [Moniliophthora roreri MCA 2997]|uniref:Uncharacterized protein n=1 Tax=Moniliophthora roreri (strain MCA 2997) TaxID=1381753 RepID=V2X004_MONRO|nr:hypothetical protein Moror_2443 [Moniliophthora roreri MCA 2997]
MPFDARAESSMTLGPVLVFSRPDDIAALAASTNGQDDSSILTALNSDPDDPLAVIYKQLYYSSKPLQQTIPALKAPTMLARVSYRHTFTVLKDLFRKTAIDVGRFSIEERIKYESPFEAITTILQHIPDTEEGGCNVKSISSECFTLIRDIFSSLHKGIFIVERSESGGMLEIQAPLGDKLEEFAAGASVSSVLFSVQRWIYKVFSLELLALRLIHCCQTRFIRSLPDRPFEVKALRSP